MIAAGRAGLLLLALTGCAIQPVRSGSVDGLNPVPLAAFELDGRLAVRNGSHAGQMSLHWRHGPAGDTLTLYSPLGQTLGVLTSDSSGAVMQDAQHRSEYAANVEALSQKWLGWPLPLDGLGYWVTGSARPNLAFEVSQNVPEHGQIVLKQSGWTVTYLRWRQLGGRAVPDKLDLAGNGVSARLVVSDWRVGE